MNINMHAHSGLWKHLESMATLVDSAAQCMLDMSPGDDREYLATKRLLISSQWKFAHCCSTRGLADVPKVSIIDDQLQPTLTVHLPGMGYIITLLQPKALYNNCVAIFCVHFP